MFNLCHQLVYIVHTYSQETSYPNIVKYKWYKKPHNLILWNSPVARHLWRECKTILHAIKIPFNYDSYYSAILALDDPNLQHADEEVKLSQPFDVQLNLLASRPPSPSEGRPARPNAGAKKPQPT